MKKYDESIKKLKETPFEIKKCVNTEIIGNIENKTSGILQISTSYSKGWKAYVDGVETKVLNVNTGLIGININPGKHRIVFKYATPYLKLGIITTFLGLIWFMYLHRKTYMIQYKKIKQGGKR